MRIRPLFSLVRWGLALAFVGSLLAVAYAVHEIMRERRGSESGEAGVQEKKLAGNVVKLGAELAESFGLKEEAARETQWQPQLPVYGRIVPNPRASAEIRAPFAGTLQAAADTPWSVLGSRVQAGDVLGWLDIRVGPQELLDLEIKLRVARAKLRGAEEVFKIQQERLQRFQTLEGPGAV